jgi:hypothetical protein
MSKHLTVKELDRTLESLAYTKKAYDEYRYYPSYEFKLKQLGRVEADIAKVRALRAELLKK